MNNITIAGVLGKDAETRYLPNGDPVASFSVADSQGKDKPTIWWNCSLFGKRAESLAPYLTKGQAVTVSGTITEREYTDKDGTQRKAMEVRVQDVALQGGKRDAQPQAPQRAAPAKAAPSGFDDSEEIPF
jgi:single-strand DNA-binding protein